MNVHRSILGAFSFEGSAVTAVRTRIILL